MKKIVLILIQFWVINCYSIISSDNYELIQRGEFYYNISQYYKAIDIYNQLKYNNKDGNKKIETIANIGLAACYYKMDKQDLAKEHYIYYKEAPINAQFYWQIDSLASISDSLFNRAEYQKALEYEQIIIKSIKKNISDINSFYANHLSRYAYLLDCIGKTKEALSILKDVYNLRLSLDGIYHPDYYDSLHDLYLLYSKLNEFDYALDFLLEKINIIDLSNHENYYNYSRLFSDIGDAYFNKGDYSQAIKYQNKSISFLKSIDGDSTSYIAESLNILSGYYYMLGKTSTAIKLGRKSKDLYELSCEFHNPEYAHVLENLALYNSEINLKESISYINEASFIYKINNDTSNLVSSLCYKFDYLWELQKKQEKKYSEQFIKLLEDIHKYDKSVNPINSFYNLADKYILNEEYDVAIEVYDYILSIPALNKVDSVLILESIIDCNDQLGRSSKVVSLCDELLESINNEQFANDSVRIAMLNNICYFYCNNNAFDKAIDLANKCINHIKKCNVYNFEDYVISLNNLACTWGDLGNLDRAIDLLNYVELKQKQHGDTISSSYGRTLNNLATYYDKNKQSKVSIDLYLKAATIFENNLDHKLYFKSLINLIVSYSKEKDYNKALNLGLKVLNYLNENNSLTLDYGLCLLNLSCIYSDLGNYNEALKYGEVAINVLEKIVSKNHPLYLQAISNYSGFNFKCGNYSLSEKYLIESICGIKKYLLSSFITLPYKERSYLWFNLKSLLDYDLPFLSYSINTDELASQLYDGLLFSKGLLLSSEVLFREIIYRQANSIQKKYKQLCLTQETLNNRYFSSDLQNKAKLDSLENCVLIQERNLLNELNDKGHYHFDINVSWKDIKECIESDEIAIEFFQVQDSIYNKYCALTITKEDKYPKIIYLFSDHDVNNFQLNDSTNLIYNLIWKKLENRLNGINKIYFSPTGKLNCIPIEYALISQGSYLTDKYKVYRLSSTKEIIGRKVKHHFSNAVLFGGINYNAVDSVTKDEDTKRNYRYSYLPGTLEEINNICNIFDSKRVDYQVYSDISASEKEFKDLSGKDIDLLHIATHGYYYTDKKSKEKNKSFILYSDWGGIATEEDRALTRSGLILYGANNLFLQNNSKNSNDGILTSGEVSLLNLRKVQLVVLSTCKSGLGDIESEGVYGLQRGFKKAGVQTILMSLWDIDDYVTQLMMRYFYRGLSDGMSVYESLIRAQNTIRTVNNGEFSNPFYWSGFIILDGQ